MHVHRHARLQIGALVLGDVGAQRDGHKVAQDAVNLLHVLRTEVCVAAVKQVSKVCNAGPY